MSGKKTNTWLLAEPKKELKFKKTTIKRSQLDQLITEAVLDTIRPYGSSKHRQEQYKKVEKYDHLLETINKNLINLVESVKRDLSYGYLSDTDAEFIVNDHFERAIDSISYAGSAIIASIGKEDEENY